MIRVCIAGNSGHAATVTRALPRLPQVEIVGWCRTWAGEPMTEVLADFTALGLCPPEFFDYRAMVQEMRPDVLVVDGMFCDHEQMTVWALEHQVHVYCDKPLAFSLEGLARVQRAAAQSSHVLWAMQTARYDPWFYTARVLIEEGAIGDIRLLSAQKSYRLGTRAPFFSNRTEQGGLIPWVAIHGIDFIRFLCPLPAESVFAAHSRTAMDSELETACQIMLTLEGGVMAQVSADYLRPTNAATHGDDRIRAVGTAGVLEVRDDKVFITNDTNDGTAPLPLRECPMIFEDFISTVSGGGRALLNAAESFEDTRLALLARQSADEHRLLSICPL